MDDSNPTAGSRRVYFLIGAQRSGTTLLRLMLDHHPRIAHTHEFNWALQPLEDDGGEPPREAYWERVEATREFRHLRLEPERQLGCAEAVKSLLDRIYGLRGRNKPIAGVTIHFQYRAVLRYWPDARFIHLIRDPRDVAPSVIKMGWAATHWHAVRLWSEAEHEVEDLASILVPDRLLHLRYEDLVREPERELGRICGFLGDVYDPTMLTYPEDSTYPPPDASLADRWRSELQEDEVRLIESRAGELMAQRGYASSGLPPLRLSPVRKMWLTLRDRCGILSARMRKYGASNVIGHAFATRLGMTGTARRLRIRMQDIEQKRLR